MKINIVVHPHMYIKRYKILLLFFSVVIRHNLPLVNRFAFAKWYIAISPPQIRKEGELIKGFHREHGVVSLWDNINANTKA